MKLSKFTGTYAVRDLTLRRIVDLKENQRINFALKRHSSVLCRWGPYRFVVVGADGVPGNPPATVSFQSQAAEGMRLNFNSGAPLGSYIAERYDPELPTHLDGLLPLVGKYRSEELQVTYNLYQQR